MQLGAWLVTIWHDTWLRQYWLSAMLHWLGAVTSVQSVHDKRVAAGRMGWQEWHGVA